MTKPDIVTDEHLFFLDDLRESGITDMFVAAPYVQDRFGLDDGPAKEILNYWMMSFSDRHPKTA